MHSISSPSSLLYGVWMQYSLSSISIRSNFQDQLFAIQPIQPVTPIHLRVEKRSSNVCLASSKLNQLSRESTFFQHVSKTTFRSQRNTFSMDEPTSAIDQDRKKATDMSNRYPKKTFEDTLRKHREETLVALRKINQLTVNSKIFPTFVKL